MGASKPMPPLLFQSLFGKSGTISSAIRMAILMAPLWFVVFDSPWQKKLGIDTIPPIPADYQIAIGILGFLLILLKTPYEMLRHPRRTTWNFVIGLTFTQRLESCSCFIKKKVAEFLAFGITFFVVRNILIFVIKKKIDTFDIFLPEIPVLLILGVMYYYSKSIVSWVKPSKKEYLDKAPVVHGKIQGISSAKLRTLLLARKLAFLSKGNVHTVTMRIFMYIFRKDLPGTVFIQIAGILICTVIAFLLPPSVELLARIALLVAPLILLGEMRETIIVSVSRLFVCPYYYFTNKESVKGLLYICMLQFIPYIFLYCFRQFVVGADLPVIAIVNFIFTALAISIIMSNGFMQAGAKTKGNGASIFFFAAPLLLTTLIPVIGILLAVTLIFWYSLPLFAKEKNQS
jgi:hypothetical protein